MKNQNWILDIIIIKLFLQNDLNRHWDFSIFQILNDSAINYILIITFEANSGNCRSWQKKLFCTKVCTSQEISEIENWWNLFNQIFCACCQNAQTRFIFWQFKSSFKKMKIIPFTKYISTKNLRQKKLRNSVSFLFNQLK